MLPNKLSTAKKNSTEEYFKKKREGETKRNEEIKQKVFKSPRKI